MNYKILESEVKIERITIYLFHHKITYLSKHSTLELNY